MVKPLLIGPVPPPVNGQSNCFQVIMDAYPTAWVVDRNVDQYGFFRKTLKFLLFVVVAVWTVVINRPNVIYISLSRSWPGYLTDSMIILLGKVLRVNTVVHLHGNDFLNTKLKARLFGWVYSLTAAFVVLSSAMQKRVAKSVNACIKIVINPIHDQFLERTAQKPDDKQVRIIYMSNILRSKGIFDFLHLAERMGNSNIHEFHVVGAIFGDHLSDALTTEHDFKSRLSELTNVTYHGPLYGSQQVQFISEMDVLVFPSFYPVEALPLSILETAALGLYPIINDHNDLCVFKELLPNVHVCNTSDIESVSAYISSLEKSEIRALGNQNAVKAREYGVASHVESMSKIINDAC